MTFDELKALDHAHTLQTYGRFDVDVDHGQGATLWDLAGRTYIDFTSGIGVCSVGYGEREVGPGHLRPGRSSPGPHLQPVLLPALRPAGRRCSAPGRAWRRPSSATPARRPTRGFIKLARKYSLDKYGEGRGTILTLRNSFHGRTLTTLAATGQDVFHQHFFPFTEGFRYTGANDLADVEAQAGARTCAP